MIFAVDPELMPFILYPTLIKSGPSILAIFASELIIILSESTYPLPISINISSLGINALSSRVTKNGGSFDLLIMDAKVCVATGVPASDVNLLISNTILAGDVF